MAYADLTAQEQANLQDWINTWLRSLTGNYANWLSTADWAKEAYDAKGIAAILAQLVDTDTIPNDGSGLGAATTVTKLQTTTLLSILNANLTNDNTAAKREGYVAFAGVNVLQQS